MKILQVMKFIKIRFDTLLKNVRSHSEKKLETRKLWNNLVVTQPSLITKVALFKTEKYPSLFYFITPNGTVN